MAHSGTGYRQSIRQFISEPFRYRLIQKISRDEKIDQLLAEKIVDQTLAFLKLVADNPGESYTPSPLVDVGWHAFILHTRRYVEFCQKISGSFIHHDPVGEGAPLSLQHGTTATEIALKSAELPVDEELWAGVAKCGGVSCTNGDCTSGGPPRSSW